MTTAWAPNYDRRLFDGNHPGEGIRVKVGEALGLGYPAEETFIQCHIEVVGKDVKLGTQTGQDQAALKLKDEN